METTAITAATPMTMPSSVRMDRSRFARNEESATRMASEKFMILEFCLLHQTWTFITASGRTSPATAGFFLPSTALAEVWFRRLVSGSFDVAGPLEAVRVLEG